LSSGENIVIKKHILLISKTLTLTTKQKVKTESKNGNGKVNIPGLGND
jgi:hypothetical protein